MPFQERHVEFFLELADLRAERWLGDAERLRGCGHIRQVDDLHQILDLFEIDDGLPAFLVGGSLAWERRGRHVAALIRPSRCEGHLLPLKEREKEERTF